MRYELPIINYRYNSHCLLVRKVRSQSTSTAAAERLPASLSFSAHTMISSEFAKICLDTVHVWRLQTSVVRSLQALCLAVMNPETEDMILNQSVLMYCCVCCVCSTSSRMPQTATRLPQNSLTASSPLWPPTQSRLPSTTAPRCTSRTT